MHTHMTRTVIAMSMAAALATSLTACGGGGGGGGGDGAIRSSSSSTTVTPTPSPSPTSSPTSSPSPTSTATLSLGQTPTPSPAPPQVTYDPTYAQLIPTNVEQAWYDGSSNGSLLQGQGVKVAILDSGAQSSNPALSGRLTSYANYVSGDDTSVQDAVGHGTEVAEDLGGVANGTTDYMSESFRGGVAPGASLYIARVDDDTGSGTSTNFATGLNAVLNQGVRLINLSQGDTTSITQAAAANQQNNPNSELAAWTATFQPILAKDALLVVAAGNNGFTDPTIMAGLPYLESQFSHNMLAVVNVDLDANGKVTGLDTTVPSNACGVAASWCLAAPGMFWGVPAAGSSEFASGGAEGTSLAAPIVTGVAALVWQEYPWMSASNVQETILGTATSLGNSALYGYGLINADAAIHGPGRFDWGVFDANLPADVSATFSNPISGAGSLQLDGAGQLTLSNTNTYTGGTVINGGTLTVNGSIASAVSIANGAALTGSGVINANVTSSGSVATTFGALTINGNYVANSGANTTVLIGTPLKVNGTATITGTDVTTIVPNGYTPAATEPLLLAAGGLTGTFGSLSTAGSVYLSGTLSYTANGAYASLTNVSTTAVATAAVPASNTNVMQSAQHIDAALQQVNSWVNAGTPGHDQFIASAAAFQHAPTLSDAAMSIGSLSGQIHASSEALSLSQAGIVNRALTNRLTDDVTTGAWMQAIGSNGDIGRSGFATGQYSGGGGMAGIDGKVADNFLIGAAAQWDKLNASYDDMAGSSNSRSQGVSLYGRFNAGDAYVLGRVGQDWISSYVNRNGVLGLTPATIDTDRDDRLTSLYVESGYRFGTSSGAITPFVSLTQDHLDRGGFTEHGAGGFGLTADSQSFDQTLGQVGARYSATFRWSAGVSQFSAYALWQSVLSGQNTAFRAAYVGAPTAVFDVSGDETPDHSGWVGLGMTTKGGSNWSWYVNADVQVGAGATKSRSVSAGLRWEL